MLTTFRGDVFSVPAAEGAVYNFTRTPGAHDRDAVWSPDGKWIAWLSDESGEYQVYVMPPGQDLPDILRNRISFLIDLGSRFQETVPDH